MKTYLDCFPCFLNQSLKTARIITEDEELIHFILGEVGSMLKDIPLHHTPPETGELIYRTISEHTGIADPYKKIKEANIAEAKQFLPYIQKKSADLIISKGQGNYEGLSNENYPIFFLLKAKCQVIADDLGVPKDSIIVKQAEVK